MSEDDKPEMPTFVRRPLGRGLDALLGDQLIQPAGALGEVEYTPPRERVTARHWLIAHTAGDGVGQTREQLENVFRCLGARAGYVRITVELLEPNEPTG